MAQKKWTTANGGKKDLLHTQYVANKYFDTVEWKRHRASIILSKKKNVCNHLRRDILSFCPRLRSFFLSVILAGRAPQNFMAVYFVPLCAAAALHHQAEASSTARRAAFVRLPVSRGAIRRERIMRKTGPYRAGMLQAEELQDSSLTLCAAHACPLCTYSLL